MKSLNFFVIAVIICILGVSSCNKDENTVNLNNSKISQEDLDTEKKITSFIDKMNNPSMLKSDELISVDEALWNLEAACNYLFADIPDQYEEVIFDSITICLPVQEGMCSEADVLQAYTQIVNGMDTFLNANSDYKPVVMGVRKTDDTQCGFYLDVIVAKPIDDYAITPPILAMITNGWRPIYSYCCIGGQCVINGSSHTHIKTCEDLATEIKRLINNYAQKDQKIMKVEYWTDITSGGPSLGFDILNPNDAIPGDNDRDYLVYRTMFMCLGHCDDFPCVNTGACLSVSDCNFYLHGTFKVLYKTLEEFHFGHYGEYGGMCPQGKKLIQIIEAYGDVVPAMDDAYYFHYFYTQYGTPHVRSN